MNPHRLERKKKYGAGGDNEKRRAHERTLVAVGDEVGGLGQLHRRPDRSRRRRDEAA
jgi:hypothetical protein